MNKLLILLSVTFCMNAWSESLSEDKAISKLNEFFELLDLEVYEKDNIEKILTEDFKIFEMGKSWNMDEFDTFLQEASETTISTDWDLSEYRVSLDDNSAHISYVNNGTFVNTDGEVIYSYWLESVYMVREQGELKLKFLQSDLVNREVR